MLYSFASVAILDCFTNKNDTMLGRWLYKKDWSWVYKMRSRMDRNRQGLL